MLYLVAYTLVLVMIIGKRMTDMLQVSDSTEWHT
jgi:hypothetical protein